MSSSSSGASPMKCLYRNMRQCGVYGRSKVKRRKEIEGREAKQGISAVASSEGGNPGLAHAARDAPVENRRVADLARAAQTVVSEEALVGGARVVDVREARMPEHDQAHGQREIEGRKQREKAFVEPLADDVRLLPPAEIDLVLGEQVHEEPGALGDV